MEDMAHATADDEVQFITDADVQVVLDRVPATVRGRLRDVFLHHRSRGARSLGRVRTRGRRDIELVSILPPRVSLSRFIVSGQAAHEFGAPARGQWPPLAVRRFLLYDVLLHELGHLQCVRPGGRSWRRRFAGETLAQRFADDLRHELWSRSFDHRDPTHDPPGDRELAFLPVWEALDKTERRLVVDLTLGYPNEALATYELFAKRRTEVDLTCRTRAPVPAP